MPEWKRYDDDTIKTYLLRRQMGEGNDRICDDMGINRKTGTRWQREHRHRLLGMVVGQPAPKTPQQIAKHAVAGKAIKDFALFRLIVFGHKTDPWEADCAARLLRMVEGGHKEFAVINVAPGSGKTELMKAFVCWLIARDRTIRIIWGSAADRVASMRVNQIREVLAATAPIQPNAKDIRTGRAVKPRYCMAELFGKFRPAAHFGVKWRDDELTVAMPGIGGIDEGQPPAGPTLLAFGRQSKQLGPRAEFIVWDDLWSSELERSPKAGAVVKDFFDQTAENRLQPEGALAVVMQRLGANDISRHCLDKRRAVLDEEGRRVGWEPLYQHIVYPAHHDDLCDGTHPPGVEPWDPKNPQRGRCITDPHAHPPHDLLAQMENDRFFQVTFQQKDVDPAAALIKEVWLTGGTDADGFTFPGCLDYDRGLWELPHGVPKGELASAVAIDVGQEGYWGLYASVSSTDPHSEKEWILAAEHRIMPAGTEAGLLDWDFDQKRFVGILDEWWQMSNAIGKPFTVVIAEMNAAQRHLFRKMNVLERWKQYRHVLLLLHNTASNKRDQKTGFEAIVPMRFQLGAVRIPWRPGETQAAMRDFYQEAKHYGQNWTDDMLMAQWMRTLHRKKITRPVSSVPSVVDSDLPSWVQRYA